MSEDKAKRWVVGEYDERDGGYGIMNGEVGTKQYMVAFVSEHTHANAEETADLIVKVMNNHFAAEAILNVL